MAETESVGTGSGGVSKKLAGMQPVTAALLASALPLAQEHIGLGFLAVAGAIFLAWYHAKRQGDIDAK